MPFRYDLVEPRRLKYFIAIAEQGGVGRASAVLHVAQPALSRQLRLLEAEVGAELFARQPNGMMLTPAGDVFLKGARQILDDSARLASMARAVAQGRSGELSVGVSDVYCWHPTVVSMVRAFRDRYPDIELRLMPLLSGDIAARVLAGRLDCGMVFASEPMEAPLARTPVLRDRLALAVHRDWPMPAKLALHQFGGADFIVPSRELSPKLYDRVIKELASAGLVPPRLRYANSHTAALGLVAAGMGCAVVPECAHLRVPGSVVVRRVAGLRVAIPIELIRLRDNALPALARFAEVVRGETGRARAEARRVSARG